MNAARLALYYAAIFGTVGVLLPFWPLWLKSQGLNASEIGIVLAGGAFIRIAGNPLAAHVADRTGERRSVIAALAALAFAVFLAFHLAAGFWQIFLLALLFFGLWSAMQPLAESLTMLTARAEGFEYGRVRLWGSIAFIVVAVGSGKILGLVGDGAVLALMTAGLGLSLAVALALPATTAPKAAAGRAPVLPLLADARFVLFLSAAALIQASHAVYYGFGTIHWRAAGYSETVIGALWAEGVVAEIVLFAAAGTLVAKLGPARLIALGGAAGLIRWVATGLSDALPVLVIVQALHAFTFGATHLGAIHYIARTVPLEYSASAQSLYSAAVMGLAAGLASIAAGALYGTVGAGGFFVMAAMAAAGGIAALVLAGKGA